MKKKVLVISCLLLYMLISGCQHKKKEPVPIVVAKHFLDAYQAKDESKVLHYSEWKDFRAKSLEMQENDYIVGVDKALQTNIFNMTIAFQHKELSEKITKDSAQIKVELLMYDFIPAIQAGMKEATKKANELAQQSNRSDASIQAEITTIVFENIKQAKMEKKQIITLQLIKAEDTWLVSNNNKELQDFLYQNMNSLKHYGI